MIDVDRAVSGEPNRILATAALAKMFREGLNDALALPEIQTDADVATHALLGCEKHMHVYMLASFVSDTRNAKDVPPSAVAYMEGLLSRELLLMAAAVTRGRGPIGETKCQ